MCVETLKEKCNIFLKSAIRKLKYVIFVLLCVIMPFATSGCTFIDWLVDDWLTKPQREIIDEAMSRLCSAIESGDSAAIKKEFAAYDIAKIDNFDESVQKLVEYISGCNIKYKFTSSGSEEAAMGSYPRIREFGGTNYELTTDTDRYKVALSYCSYYKYADHMDEGKIGFTHFDIINAADDRQNTDDRPYSGCPFWYKGINIGYTTQYVLIPEDFDFKVAYCEKSADFVPVIINDTSALNSFYEAHKDEYTLGSREDGKGYTNIALAYDDEFFRSHSLFIVGIYNEGGGYCYYPQSLYIGDFVYVRIAKWDDEWHLDSDQYAVGGFIYMVELPERVPGDMPASVKIQDARA